MSNLEYLAAALGIVNIVLIVLRSLWNYPFGIAMVALSFFVFFEARLYSDALLQIFFLVVQIYGWWSWLRGRDTQGALIVERAGMRTVAGWSVGIAIATGLWGWLMHRLTNAAFPWWDAAVAMISIAAQIMMSRRWIENWMLWVLVDGLAVGLYATRGLWAFAGLYVVFFVVAAWGWWEWIRVGRSQEGKAVSAA
ncbi:MAG: nicotinamide mononucleotide transporter [Sphingobium sp.]|nr:nicotinamide mononucleotide transporter [Sphingobium sp.]